MVINYLQKVMILFSFLTLTSCVNSTKEKNNHISKYKSLSKKLYINGNWDLAVEVAKKELIVNNLSVEDKLYYLLQLGKNYRFLEKYDLSEKYFNEVVHNTNSNSFPKILGQAFYGLGDLYYLKWSYFKDKSALSFSEKFLDSSLSISNKINDFPLKSKNLYRLGSLLQIQGDKEKSLHNFKEGLDISLKIKDTAGIIRNDIHKALELERKKSLDSALFHYQRAYKYAKAQNRNYSEAHALCNLGLFYFDRKDYKTAESYFNKAKYISEELNHTIILCRSYYSLSELNAINNNEELSKKYFTKGLALAKEKGYKNFIAGFESLGKSLNYNF